MTLGTFASAAARGLGLRARVAQGGLSNLKSAGTTTTTTRSYAAGGKGETFEGVTIHHASNWHKFGAQAFGGVMWFWIFYRLRNDFDTFMFGHAQHFEHEMEHEKEGGHH
ncbi:hypothetical protein HOP50_06g45840 [Chloropicon primus]|uniref:Uncharacterized protein n=1 Tax=Chloropicon primus TaxID=1764295 RepID=A0A5B8MRY8_9CHLO|nr:hypothetical protein A3770_06p45600 [Chloropicon primus]UPR01262.1 hypothetical protein HOP50_06g45840 [Chloropicon primus]|mmetsp:Transcript_12943/g.36285  ORF Transcript_12943/g.36285 Transcript_12943/m.36285 type:complete len:110 (+) Transcript_12943:124-453(+)|eukprot:QDZ22042.1 hypothetical protein A3770_06p45600 [Chloropicon primus]